MSIDKDALLNKYIPLNIPVPYKDWQVHSIKIKDWYDVAGFVYLLEQDKNILGQIEYISMSNLRFFLFMAMIDDEHINQFYKLLKLALDLEDDDVIKVCMTDNSEYLKIGKSIGKTRDNQDIINDSTAKIIKAEDFDEIRRIILFQNILDYTDEYVDPDVKKKTEEYFRLKNKGKSISLEHKIICLQMKTGMTTEAIGNLTVRNFQLLFGVMVDESDYTALRMAEANGVKFKTPLEHWAYHERKNKYEEAFCDAEAFKKTIQDAN